MTDDILQRIQNDIDRCKAVAASGDKAAARVLSGELVRTYKGMIKNFSMGLTEFSYFEVANYIKDILTLSRKLEAYAASLRPSSPDADGMNQKLEASVEKREIQKGIEEGLQPTAENKVSTAGNKLSIVGNKLSTAENKVSKAQEIEELLNGLKNKAVAAKDDPAYLKKIEEIELSYRKQIPPQERWTELKDVIVWSSGLQPDIGCDVLRLILKICDQK